MTTPEVGIEEQIAAVTQLATEQRSRAEDARETLWEIAPGAVERAEQLAANAEAAASTLRAHAALARENEALRAYAQHGSKCDLVVYPDHEGTRCTCGLAAARGESGKEGGT